MSSALVEGRGRGAPCALGRCRPSVLRRTPCVANPVRGPRNRGTFGAHPPLISSSGTSAHSGSVTWRVRSAGRSARIRSWPWVPTGYADFPDRPLAPSATAVQLGTSRKPSRYTVGHLGFRRPVLGLRPSRSNAAAGSFYFSLKARSIARRMNRLRDGAPRCRRCAARAAASCRSIRDVTTTVERICCLQGIRCGGSGRE